MKGSTTIRRPGPDLVNLAGPLTGEDIALVRPYSALLVPHHAAHRPWSSPPESADWGLSTTLVGSRLGGG